MKLEVIYSQEALNDVIAILFYYSEFISYTMAENIELGLSNHIDVISKNPSIGHKDSLLNRSDYLVFVSVNYKILYQVIEDKLFIVRIFDSRQNPSKLIR